MSIQAPFQHLASPYELVFSCAICQTSITELYRHPQSDYGFSSGEGDQEHIVTRLWLTECGHLTCSDHFDGQGVPFHPKGQRPKAPCPVCVSEKGDATSRQLFGIISQRSDRHDEDIPDEYFAVPAAKIKGSSHASSALRFQYLSLLRYAGVARKRLQDAKRAAKISRAQFGDLAASVKELREESGRLRARIHGLEKIEAQYFKYKKREPEIRHYLGNCAALALENSQLKNELTALGYEVPRTTWAFDEANAVTDRSRPNGRPDVLSYDQQNTQEHKMSSGSGRKRVLEQYLEQAISNPPAASVDSLPLRTPLKRSNPKLANSPSEAYSRTLWGQAKISHGQRGTPYVYENEIFDVMGNLPSKNSNRKILDHIPISRRPPFDREHLMAFRDTSVQNDAISTSLARSSQYSRSQNPLFPVEREYNNSFMSHGLGPPSCVSRSSVMRQSLGSHISHGNHIRLRDSGYQSIVDGPATKPPCYQAPKTVGKNEQIVHYARQGIETRFFHRDIDQGSISELQTPMLSQSVPVQRPEELLSDFGRPRMRQPHDLPTAGQSLNSLSFIKEPYTLENRPVYDRQYTSRPLLPHPFARGKKTFINKPYAKQGNITSLGDEERHVTRPREETRLHVRKTHDSRLDALKGVKKAGILTPTYSSRPFSSPYSQILSCQQQRNPRPLASRRSVQR